MLGLSLRRFVSDRCGAVLAEFGVVFPILVVILLGCYDAARFVLIHQKLDRVAMSMANLVARSDGISAAQIDDLFTAMNQLAAPYGLAANGRVIVTSVYRPNANPPSIAWQRASPGAVTEPSRIGESGGEATLPSGFTVRTGENVIIAEVWYHYTPMFAGFIFGSTSFYHTAFVRPRIINLTTLN